MKKASYQPFYLSFLPEARFSKVHHHLRLKLPHAALIEFVEASEIPEHYDQMHGTC